MKKGGGLYEPGYYGGNAIVVAKMAIEREAIDAWYRAAHIAFSFHLPWEPVLIV